MNSPTWTRIIALALLAALAIPAQMAAQEPENQSATTSTANPLPGINQPLVPDAAKPGVAGFPLTVNGTGFVSGAVVNWNGSARATTFVSSSRLEAAILSFDVAKPGTASVTVVNPSPGGGTSNVAFFEVTPSFGIALSRSDRGVVSSVRSVIDADFNGDGKLDLAVTNGGDNAVSVLLGNGDGTFRSQVNYSTGNSPNSVAVGDFNGDGKLDLVVVNYLDNSISVLLGNGDGTFRAHVDYATGGGPNSVAVGDFNGDGRLDLAVTGGVNRTVSVLLGNGDGSFEPQVDYETGSSPQSVAVGDLKGDGKLDLVVANANSNTVSVLLGNGDGSFQGHVDYATGSAPMLVAMADLNGDGILDLAVAAFADNGAVSVLLGKGDGTFLPHVDYATGGASTSAAVGDLNGDGKLDLAVSNAANNTVSVLLANGDGTFQPHLDYGTASYPISLSLGDFNRDGRLDLAVASNGGNTVSILLEGTLITISPASLNFGAQALGTGSAVQNVHLTNIGTSTLTISSMAVTGTNATDFSQTNTCGSSLSVGLSCTIGVTFKPSKVGLRKASFIITDNAVGNPQSVALKGTGVTSGPNTTLSPTSLTFTTQLVGTSSPAQSVTLTNYGETTLNITSITTSGDFSQTHTCGSSLATGASCTVSVTFKPTQRGTRTGTLSITDNAPGSPQTVSLTAAGTVVEFNPPSLGFGTVTVPLSSSPQTTTLTNTGNTQLNISSISITGSDPGDFSQSNNCNGSVAAGKSCAITVTFKPPQRGSRSANVSVSDDGGGSPQQVALSGTGVFRGRCQVNSNNKMLSGYCVEPQVQHHPISCVKFVSDNTECPPGQPATTPGSVVCGLQSWKEDESRPCGPITR
jgi:FG-GAP-like repeat/Abnormal spindle-like microcephaly-assoc'd, ASPM-SPD-2-Hydin